MSIPTKDPCTLCKSASQRYVRMAADPDTPPVTPDPGKGTGAGPANVQGNVTYHRDIKNSIATGHIYGYEVIVGES